MPRRVDRCYCYLSTTRILSSSEEKKIIIGDAGIVGNNSIKKKYARLRPLPPPRPSKSVYLEKVQLQGVSLAADHLRAGSLVGAAAHVRVALRAVDVDVDAGVLGQVGAGEADGGAGREGAGARDLDLGARLVELGGARGLGRVQGEDLDAQQVLAGGDALGEVEVGPAVVGHHAVDAPLLVARVEAVLGDLEPLQAVERGGGGVVDLGQVGHDGPHVRVGDWVVLVAGELGAADDVLPVGADLVAGRHVDDLLGRRAGLAADHRVAVDILDRVVVVGRPEAVQLTRRLSIHRQLLKVVGISVSH